MSLHDSRTGIEVIERRECLSLLAGKRIGRLGIVDGGEPLVLPITYALDGEGIVFRTGAGSKLDASRGGPACFEVDEIDEDHQSGWSVVLRGHLHEVTKYDQAELDRLDGAVEPWVGDRPSTVSLRPWSVTGRRLRGGGRVQ